MAKKSARDVDAAATPAIAALQRVGTPHTLHPYKHDPATNSWGLEAARVLGVEPARVFKTLMIAVDGALAVAIIPVDRQLDLKAAAHTVGAKRAAMADLESAQRATGYVAGGISPFGQRTTHRSVVDESALTWPTIYVSAGRRGLDVEVAPADLVAITGATAARIVRG